MLNREEILKTLNSENYFIDIKSLNTFIKEWHIDAIYEDDNNVEFFDDLSLPKLKKGISLKSQGFSNEQIITKLQKITHLPVLQEIEEQQEVATQSQSDGGVRNITLDVTTKTLQMLAESIAHKITDDIKNSDMAKNLIEAGGYKKDNEMLSKQIEELLEDNKRLAMRLDELEKKRGESFWIKFGKFFKVD